MFLINHKYIDFFKDYKENLVFFLTNIEQGKNERAVRDWYCFSRFCFSQS